MAFITSMNLEKSWQSLERGIARALPLLGFRSVRLVGAKGDKGADLLAIQEISGKRFVFQAKNYQTGVGPQAIDEVLLAQQYYECDVPVVVASRGFTKEAKLRQQDLMRLGTPLQLWDIRYLKERLADLPEEYPSGNPEEKLREYQQQAVSAVENISELGSGTGRKALVALATGLGKTWVGAEVMRRMWVRNPGARLLCLADKKQLVYQLERSFWPFLLPSQNTAICTGSEKKPSLEELTEASAVFATVQTADTMLDTWDELGLFDAVLVDECHHVGAEQYPRVLEELRAGLENGPLLLGLTATPWRPEHEQGTSGLEEWFGKPLIEISLPAGMKSGYLSNVDYRIFNNNINWDALRDVQKRRLDTPKGINRTIFIEEWDDAVVDELRNSWHEQKMPRALVFCGTQDHAEKIRDRVNALGFATAEALHAGIPVPQRNKTLLEFEEGNVGVLCVVDILNEGIDIPAVNIVVFQRVTHSRRIFIQQLGRGLRLHENKDKVIVLDFVSDIRRISAASRLGRELSQRDEFARSERITIPHKVEFYRHGEIDEEGGNMLREWLGDIDALEDAGDDEKIELLYPDPPKEQE